MIYSTETRIASIPPKRNSRIFQNVNFSNLIFIALLLLHLQQKQKHNNWIDLFEEKLSPLKRITPWIIGCYGFRTDRCGCLKNTIRPGGLSPARWFSSFPGQAGDICRRGAILSRLFIRGEADAYTRSERGKEPGAALGTRRIIPDCATPTCTRVCIQVLTWLYTRR